jgi:hypothetical protein
LAEVFLIRAKFSLFSLDFSQARSYFSQAQAIADQHGLQRLGRKISNDYDAILDKTSQFPVLDLPETNDIFDLPHNFATHIHPKMYQDEPKAQFIPKILQIFKSNGIPIYTKSFNSETVVDLPILGGFLSSLDIVLKHYFSEKLDRVKFGNYIAILQPFNELIILFVFKGESYTAKNLIKGFISSADQNPEIMNLLSKSNELNQKIQHKTSLEFDNLIQRIFEKLNSDENV